MIRSVLQLRPLPGKDGDVEEFFSRHRVLERATSLPGCLDASLHRPVQAGAPYVVIATWEGEADYQQWLDDPWRRSVTAELGALLDGGPGEGEGGGVYRIVQEAGRRRGDNGEGGTG
ncbi:heme-degrading monooxygenase HmoA [Thermocatellispora tengchongensis]|uniref:Heme-degrading monooxygenase HmoA n=1 Tax=Thermocatellispora tengchongensis TaxID=1073253 RepID=A0A840P0P4_9ACTN|nr:antibiotic biosynthesis monooxygenase family protein [Thermocatellispora tengchongensis]MBB5132952.1 heme-degrading monooxygenase HmoA [Thermocatellispora tengchongensis]